MVNKHKKKLFSLCPSPAAADILVYINNTCVLGRSHKEVVEMLKSVPMGQSVDVVLRRGYPMLYNPDGCPKQSLETVRHQHYYTVKTQPVAFYKCFVSTRLTATDARRASHPPQPEPRPDTSHLQQDSGRQRQHIRSEP